MKLSRISSTQALTAVVIVELVFSLTLAFHMLTKASVRGGSAPSAIRAALAVQRGSKQENGNSAALMRLVIPEINVDAAVYPIGVTQDGALEAPDAPETVGWYKSGPFPGRPGSAVIDGHYGRWADGEGSVFDNLYKLKRGDSLYIKDQKGAITSFLVREIRVFDSQADATSVFVSNDGLTHLNLITCAGTWNNDTKSYPKRLVVFTDK
jgi:LPXTG-site transpeptidase (sortase) family protein